MRGSETPCRVGCASCTAAASSRATWPTSWPCRRSTADWSAAPRSIPTSSPGSSSTRSSSHRAADVPSARTPYTVQARPADDEPGDFSVLLNAVLITLHLASCFVLVIFILLHAGRGGGLSDMFGGAGGGGMAGSTVVEKNLDRLTVVVSLVFAFTSVVLSMRLT